MGQALKADKKQETDLDRINAMVKQILALKKKEAKTKAERMQLVVQAHEIANKNRARWFGEKKSYNVDAGKLVYKTISKAITGPEFEFESFYGAFPHLFKFKPEHNISANELRTLLKDPDIGKQLELLDLDVQGFEKFEVE